ncbi:LOW QUALITY PROTEIN: carbohydrate sulfotransferase 15-like [Macrobrachium nipponense]|uniref:LOW QUALITY PROTEIN: carbohydrate sulfotransferase 15-like n=1 Tax=Macrobrachium nipponense TaxID=159736 RepID=UPI0030C7F7E7
MLWVKMRRALRPATVALLIGVAFCGMVLFSSLESVDYKVRRLRPAARLKSKQELQEEMMRNVDLFNGVGLEFLPNFKNPCWYDRQGASAKRDNLFASLLKPASAAALVSHQHYSKRSYVLRCLPYFFLIGQPKCATTDVFQRINMHPDVAGTLLKGPHWWTRRRYGQPYSPRPITFLEYLDLFTTAAVDIEGHWVNSSIPGVPFHQKITGDGSTSTLWDGSPTMNYMYSTLNKNSTKKVLQLFFNKREGFSRQIRSSETESVTEDDARQNQSRDFEGCCFSNATSKGDYTDVERTLYRQLFSIQPGVVLPVTTADIIHAVLPKSRIIAVIREPASRLYSSYAFFTKKPDISPENFDIAVQSSIQKWELCTSRYSERTCAYNKTLQYDLEVRLYNGMYNIFLRDWLNVFPEDQVLVIRMEDYHRDITATMASIYAHLGLRGLSEDEENLVNMAPVQNKNRKKGNVGKMLNKTAEVLKRFYEPYNKDLVALLGDAKFFWEDYYAKL